MAYNSRSGTAGRTDATYDNTSENDETLLKLFCNDEGKAKTKGVNVCRAPKNLSKLLKININKPLIPLKIAIFCWFAAGSALLPFMAIYLKQLGLTISELSIIYMILPFIQFFGPTVSGVVADKLGRSKPVLLANLVLTIIATNCMLFIPGLKENLCIGTLIDCNVQTSSNMTVTEHCNIRENGSHVISCTFNCSRELSMQMSDVCFQNYISACHLLSREGILHNLTIPGYVLDNETLVTCTKHNPANFKTINNTWCLSNFVSDCISSCKQTTGAEKGDFKCHPSEGKAQLFALSLILLITYNTFLSNTYRIFDVTTMSMVKTYNSDFGRQRIWAIMGPAVFAPLAGCIISAVSPEGGPQKYEAAFYIFDVMVLATIFAVWKLDITIDPPAKDMFKNTRELLKNIDILVFILTIFVNGTVWGFTRLFSAWYLEGLGASSTLMGLLVALGSIIGLPFLFTSNWFIEKVGSSNLLLLSLVGYTAWCIGYSFLINPWWSLIYEILTIVTYHLLWVSVVRHSHTIAPPGLTATVIATAGGVHYGIGKGSGSLIGGIIMSKFGGRMAYRVMASISGGTAALYALYLYARRRHKRKESTLKNTES